MSNLNKTVYLIGGFLINDNYGDVIQAKTWIDLYKKNKILFKVICYKGSKDKLKIVLKLKKNQVISIEEFMSINQKGGILHLYGGGYMNNKFGKSFLTVIKFANKRKFHIFATGVQIEASYFDKIKFIPISFISVRDSESKNIIKKNKLIIADDSFGYFYNNRFKFKVLRHISSLSSSENILLQLSLNNYVYDGLTTNKRSNQLNNLISNLNEENTLTFCSSFPKNIYGILENEKLIEAIGLNPNTFKYVTTAELDHKLIYNYKYAIVNSFHTYMLLIHKVKAPIFFLAFNDYYQQKALALKSYNMLHDSHLISEPKALKIFKNHSFHKKSTLKVNNFLSYEAKIKQVNRIVLKKILNDSK